MWWIWLVERDVAAGATTGEVHPAEGAALGLGGESLFEADIQCQSGAVEHDRIDACGARQPAGCLDRERIPVGELTHAVVVCAVGEGVGVDDDADLGESVSVGCVDLETA